MKKMFLFLALFTGLTILPSSAFAQGMMGFSGSSTDSAAIQSQQQEEQEGKQFLDNLNNKTITCSQLKDTDFEKIGEYFMGQSIGDTSRHIVMNEMMQSMMSQNGEEQMHITLGKRSSGCEGGGGVMMGYYGNMMAGWGLFGTITWLALIAFLVLGIVYFWKEIKRNN